ncbi:MAG TPA: YceI family protein [Bacteroidales bacterium]|jgi:polyisoprenoid-binding protein YceI|nr:YceI family protein [Bacteroidales bacterium]HBZ20005.1 YceI family protein [Bacteroidales bacterium]
MKRVLFLLTLTLVLSGLTNGQVKLTAVKEKSKLSWLGEKVTGQHTGSVSLQSGWLDWQDNKIVSGEFNIDMSSIKDAEGSERLEGHLKSEDFFGVEKYPTSKLVITGSTPFEKGTGMVKGNLTIKGVTNPVEFKATMQKVEEGTWFYSNIVIDRSKYNVRYGSGSFFDNLGDKTIYDEFKLKVNLLVTKS